MIFLDTSAIYAMADKSDPNHAAACQKFDFALEKGERFVTHNHVLVESVALLQSRLGLQVALLFLEEAKAFEIEWVDEALHEEARSELERIGKRQVSFVDCLSFVVMKRKGVETALAFDPDFAEQGFSLR
ncbi:MAG: PIN domain-containing protein [Deltaproteobacteria bacterium]|nr:PIN domain-containing protein [Deltaproteobacteria bacterium]